MSQLPLPIRRINFADPAEKKQHDEIVARVEEMLELQKEYAAAAREKFADKMDALKRRIDTVDAAIDAIAYRLYDLSAEEIRVVEGKENPNDPRPHDRSAAARRGRIAPGVARQFERSAGAVRWRSRDHLR